MAKKKKPAPAEEKRPEITVGGVSVDRNFMIMIVVGTLVPMLHYYGHDPIHALANYMESGVTKKSTLAYDRLFYYFVVPVLTIVLVFRENPLKYGLGLGKWREGLVWLLVVCPIMTVILWFLVRGSDMAEWYVRRGNESLAYMTWLQCVELFGWEFMWRGFWLFGMARVIGAGPAILVQAVPFALLHLGKPEVETLTTIFGGTGFGFVAWRCQSFLYAWLIHCYILVVTILIALSVAG